jgi:hypothetical protein
MMFSRRAFSQLVKANYLKDTAKVVVPESSLFGTREQSASEIREFFKKDALIIPVETIIERSEARDYAFFMDYYRGDRNGAQAFYKVVDTLEKFEKNILDRNSPAGKEFVMFKRQLYAMYEVSQRSVWEHEQFSLTVDRRNLKWLSEAKQEYLLEMRDIIRKDDVSSNKYIFQMKPFNPSRIKGLSALGLTYLAYTNLAAITLTVGPTIPMLGMIASALYGMTSLNESHTVQSIKYEADGNLEITIRQSLFVHFKIHCKVENVVSVCSLSNDDMGGDDTDGNIIRVTNFTTGDGVVHKEAVFKLPAFATRDKEVLEWVLAPSDKRESTLYDFSDLLFDRRQKRLTERALEDYSIK